MKKNKEEIEILEIKRKEKNKLKKLFENNKKIIIISIVLIIILLVLGIIFKISFDFKLNGKSNMDISYKEEYKESGYSLNVFGKNKTNDVEVKNKVKNGKVGNYKIKYKYKLGFITIEKTRIVNVVDKEKPNIELNGEESVTICPNGKYEEDGYIANDEYDGDLTDKVVIEENDDIVKYSVKDSSGNETTVERKLIKEDKESPVITLKGNKTIYLGLHSTYNESGYTVSDNCSLINEENVKVEGSVDTNKTGRYTLTYTVSDEYGNEAKETRNIHVYDPANYSASTGKSGVIYLTFDDGPSSSGSTEKILDVLKRQGIKATFFVTGNGPDSLIKKEYDEGHKIALHTYTHQWNIYKSSDAYFNDLYKIQDKVYNLTGEKSFIFRFPGGTSNTVSRHQSTGIMTALLSETRQKGFVEFDWNVDSEDAGACAKASVSDKSGCVYKNVTSHLSKSRSNIVLMHDVKSYTANAIENIIIYGKNNGYVFETLSADMNGMSFKPNN